METRKIHIRPYHGILIFILSLVLLYFLATPIQVALGMYGVGITEILLLLLAIGAALLLKAPLVDAFKIKRPKLKQFFGVLLLWIGTYILVMIITIITQIYFPGMMEVSQNIAQLFGSVPTLVALFIVAFLPAVCEEYLHRGIILYTFKDMQNKWLVVLIMGFIFGLFHLDPYRFLPTAILGLTLTYIMIKTDNILLSMLFHFINNAWAVLLSSSVNTDAVGGTVSSDTMLLGLGGLLILGASAPFIIIAGSALLGKNKLSSPKDGSKKGKINKWVLATVLTVTMFITGIGVIVANIQSVMPSFIVNETVQLEVTTDTTPTNIPFTLDEDGAYMLTLSLNNEKGISTITIIDADEEIVFNTSAGTLTSNNNLDLKSGSYRAVIEYLIIDDQEAFEKLGYDYTDKLKNDLKLTTDPNATSDFIGQIILMKLGI